MKAYFKNGKSIRITQRIANKIWEAMSDYDYDMEKPNYIREYYNNGDTSLIINVNDISYVK